MRTINPDKSPHDYKELRAFLLWNNVPDLFFRINGQVVMKYKETITPLGKALSERTFKQYFEVAKLFKHLV